MTKCVKYAEICKNMPPKTLNFVFICQYHIFVKSNHISVGFLFYFWAAFQIYLNISANMQIEINQ